MISSVSDGDTPTTDMQAPNLLESSLQLSNALMQTNHDSHPTIFRSASNDQLNGTTVSYSAPLMTRTQLSDLHYHSIYLTTIHRITRPNDRALLVNRSFDSEDLSSQWSMLFLPHRHHLLHKVDRDTMSCWNL
jgi:hypothetical protein